MMVMVLLVIMVVAVVMVFFLVIMVVVVVMEVVLVMFLSVVNFSFSSHLACLLVFILLLLHNQLLEDGKSEGKEWEDEAKQEPDVNHLDVGRLKEVFISMTSHSVCYLWQ